MINCKNNNFTYACSNLTNSMFTYVNGSIDLNIGEYINTVDITNDGWRVEIFDKGIEIYNDENNLLFKGVLTTPDVTEDMNIDDMHILYGILYFHDIKVPRYLGTFINNNRNPTISDVVNNTILEYMNKNFASVFYNRRGDIEYECNDI